MKALGLQSGGFSWEEGNGLDHFPELVPDAGGDKSDLSQNLELRVRGLVSLPSPEETGREE